MRGDLKELKDGHIIVSDLQQTFLVLQMDVTKCATMTVSIIADVPVGRRMRRKRVQVWTRRSIVDRFTLCFDIPARNIEEALKRLKKDK